ncbi:hypothetical protein DYW72_01395 [Campylobacter coli]|nr:hypothetical protein [Campylobacter coli]
MEIIKFLQDNYDVKFFSICPTSPINNYIPLGKEQNNQEFIILKKTKYSYLKKILPSKKAKLRYKRIYLTSNSFIDFFYNILRAPRAIKLYLNNRYQR